MDNSWLFHGHSWLITKTPILFPAFPSITFSTKHLAIVGDALVISKILNILL